MTTDELWENLEFVVSDCRMCPLCKGRTNTVLGEGNRRAPIMFIGEGPGAQEDLQGRAFVGPAGQLLDKMLAAIDLTREDVYIANVVKCRPPRNRTPIEEEVRRCIPYLRRQVYLVRPDIIVCLGATALRYVVDKNARITRVRGQWYKRKGYSIIATYHPAALLRDPAKKYEAWEDFKAIRDKLQKIQSI